MEMGQLVRFKMLNRKLIPYALSAATGIIVCYTISFATGSPEAWDSIEYFYYGIPIMCIAAIIISYHFPKAVWRWAFTMAIGQSVALVVGSPGSWNLWPLSIIAMIVCSLPQFICALAASWLSKRNTRNKSQHNKAVENNANQSPQN